MIEKVNPGHPDKLADRIAGAIVDLAYTKESNPKIAVEVLTGHGQCHVVIESSIALEQTLILDIIHRIGGTMEADILIVPQNTHLSRNQKEAIRCGDNGIFKGVPLTQEQKKLSEIAHKIYADYPLLFLLTLLHEVLTFPWTPPAIYKSNNLNFILNAFKNSCSIFYCIKISRTRAVILCLHTSNDSNFHNFLLLVIQNKATLHTNTFYHLHHT